MAGGEDAETPHVKGQLELAKRVYSPPLTIGVYYWNYIGIME